MEKFYFRRLDVYQNAKILAINVNEDLKTFPMEERFGLTNQLRRASTSIMFNIAEAFGRYSEKERIHFLDIANGSLMETSSELELALSYGYISKEKMDSYDDAILIMAKQIAKLRTSLNNK